MYPAEEPGKPGQKIGNPTYWMDAGAIMRHKAPFLAILLAMAGVLARADAGDPPARVARLNYQSGPVSFRPGSVEEWAAATLNYPLTAGDHLWTDPEARAEMHIGSTAVRMGSQTALAFLNLDDRTVQISLTEGSLDIRIRYLDEGETFEVDTPNVAISLLRPGDYRIDADGDRNTTVVSVRAGEAEVTGGGSAFPVRARQSAQVSGVDQVSQEVGALPPLNEFDQWCEQRDRREENSESARYVGREMTGYEDLDQHGVWNEEPDYGWVWAPRTVEIGWAPYHYGRWAWVEPWGWTWIDDAPWGFAPFHYGRWACVGTRWVWVPGRMAVRPVYAPALVVFVGGPRFGPSVGVAAWFPLGPHEVYRPAYHVSDGYVRRVNVTHVTNINVVNVNVTNVRYVNQSAPGAVMAVRHDAFVGARPVQHAGVSISERDIREARVVGTAEPVAPRRESLLGDGRAARVPPARYADRQVVARTAPPAPPVSFAARRQALEANPGRPVDPATLRTLNDGAPARPPMVRRIDSGAAGRPGGWRQANPGGQQANPVVPQRQPQSEGVRQPAQGLGQGNAPRSAPRDDRPVQVPDQPVQPAQQPWSRGRGGAQPSVQPSVRPGGDQPVPRSGGDQPAARQGGSQPVARPSGGQPARVQQQPAPAPQRNVEQPRRIERSEPRSTSGRGAAEERRTEKQENRSGRGQPKKDDR
jgi:hypothetical protein